MDPYLTALFQTLQTEHGLACRSAQQLSGGFNNRVHRVDLEDGTSVVAKKYFRDDRYRLDREYGMLTTLAAHGFREIPRPIARLDALDAAVYEHIDGRLKAAEEMTEADLAAVAMNLAKLHGLSKNVVTEPHRDAMMPAFSFADVFALIQQRVDRQHGGGAAPFHPSATKQLSGLPVIEIVFQALARFRHAVGEARMERRIAEANIRLSYSDAGPHNTMWRRDGGLVVIDLEYGGWDHPLRVVTHMLVRDSMVGLSSAQRAFFIRAFLRHSPLPAEVTDEFDDYLRLAEIEWIMLVLNRFMPSSFDRVLHAKPPGFDADAYFENEGRTLRQRLATLE